MSLLNDTEFATVVLAVALVTLVVWWVSNRNKLIRHSNRIDNAWAQVDAQLKRRADLVPNLVETVKGYAAHESSVLSSVSQARAGLLGARGEREADAANGALTSAIGRLFAVLEAYPNLKADASFGALQAQLAATEDAIAYARQTYNTSVLAYNNAVTTWPGSMFARRLGYGRRSMLAIEARDRVVPQVKLGGGSEGVRSA